MSWLGEGEGNGQPEFEGHVEAGDTRGTRRELNARQIVNRRRALPDQAEETLESVSVGGNLEDAAGREAEPGKARDQGQEEILVVVVERTVEKDVRPFGIATACRHEAV